MSDIQRCHAWSELLPGANLGYATRQSARFLKHKQTLGFMDRICFSSNIGFFYPSPCPIMLAHAISTFLTFVNYHLFFIISGLDYNKVSPKNMCLGFLAY